MVWFMTDSPTSHPHYLRGYWCPLCWLAPNYRTIFCVVKLLQLHSTFAICYYILYLAHLWWILSESLLWWCYCSTTGKLSHSKQPNKLHKIGNPESLKAFVIASDIPKRNQSFQTSTANLKSIFFFELQTGMSLPPVLASLRYYMKTLKINSLTVLSSLSVQKLWYNI